MDTENFPNPLSTEKIQALEGLSQPEQTTRYDRYIPQVGSQITHQRGIQGEGVFGEKVQYTLSRWETTDDHNGIIMVDSSDGRTGIIPSNEELTVLLRKHRLTSNLESTDTD